MSLSTFIKLVTKAFRFATIRPLQRFNVANRSKKYLGPEAKYFKPAPRAIGAMSKLTGKPPQYPHITDGGFMSLSRKRSDMLSRNQLPSSEEKKLQLSPKSFSAVMKDDNLVRGVAEKLRVLKTVIPIDVPSRSRGLLHSMSSSGNDDLGNQSSSKSRNLPTLTSLQLSDPSVIWHVDKVPEGRIDLNSLQELMINKLADTEYWTPERIAERYRIKPEYASLLTKYIQQMRIVISPRMKNLLDYVARDDPLYQATKDTLYIVDRNLRSELDKRYDKMFLPGEEELDERVREVLGASKTLEVKESKYTRLEDKNKLKTPRRPTALKLEPINTLKTQESDNNSENFRSKSKQLRIPR